MCKEENALTVREQDSGMFLSPAVSVNVALEAWQAKKEFISGVLKENVDFGTIPGTGNKPALLKPGAEKIAAFFGLSPTFEDIETVEDWTGKEHNEEPFFYYRQKCTLRRGERVIGSADGSCNSWEKKYRYRQQERVCPQCGLPAIIKGRAEYGGGWLCFKKKGGCGAKFGDNSAEIVGQDVGVIPNPDIADQVNTMLKMAQKRALVAAVLISTNVSDYFTQDIEDYVEAEIITETPSVNVRKATKNASHNDGYQKQNQPVSARPYDAKTVKHKVTEFSMSFSADETLNMPDVRRQVLASVLDTTLEDKMKRYELCEWLTGTASTKEMEAGYVLAMLKWQGVGGFDQMPSEEVKQETHACHSAALVAKGQLEMAV